MAPASGLKEKNMKNGLNAVAIGAALVSTGALTAEKVSDFRTSEPTVVDVKAWQIPKNPQSIGGKDTFNADVQKALERFYGEGYQLVGVVDGFVGKSPNTGQPYEVAELCFVKRG